MKLRTSFLMRCLAMVMALALLVSGTNLGVALQVFAAEGDETVVTVGEVVANNYDLTDAEKDLLSSGNLAGEAISYTAPANSDNLIAVDTENAQISAETFGDWVPATAYIVAGGEVVETVAIENGVCAYDPSVGNAFSVKVDYVLNAEVDAEVQETLLNTSAWLKDGVANLNAAYNGTDTGLGTLSLAMDTLVRLANGMNVSMGPISITIQFESDAANAIREMKANMDANNGSLSLQLMNNAFNASSSKVEYLLNNGAAYKAELNSLYNKLALVAADGLMNNQILDSYMAETDPAAFTQWSALKSILGNMVDSMEAVVNADWTAAEKGTALVAADADYAELDTLVAALGDVTAVAEIVNPLVAATATVQANLSMKNVEVIVELYVVENETDSDELVLHGSVTDVLTVGEGLTAEQVAAAVADSGVADDALAAWADVYAAEHFEVSYSELPAALNEDITYTITYAPKTYTVTFGEGFTGVDPMDVPYGYQLTLARHEDPAKAYDYTIDGEVYAQGSVYVVAGDVTITRALGKAYTNTSLYNVLADNFGNDIAKEILKSGALNGNVAINVRKPDAADAASLVTLFDGELTAVATYASDYAGLNWVPYSFGTNGNENLFAGANTATWNADQVKVQYILNLSNFSVEEVATILDTVAALDVEAAEQIATLDRLAAYYDTMGQLDKTKLGALNGVIDVTDFSSDPAKNAELRAYFKGLVSSIIANSLDTNNYLKIYNILGDYLDANDGGLKYYYANSDLVINEIDTLSGYLTGLLADDEKVAALGIMVGAAGFPEYAEKISDLETIMSEVKAALKAPNAIINLESENLNKLVDALESEAVVETAPAATPYLVSETLTAMDSSKVMVQVFVTAGGATKVITSASFDRNHVLTADDVADIQAKIDAAVAELLGANAKYYTETVSGAVVADMVGTALSEIVNTYYEYVPKTYSVLVGENVIATFTVENTQIALPKHPTQGWEYKYTIDGVADITSASYTFTLEQIDRLFVDGSYTITRTASNVAAEKFEDTFAEGFVIVKDEDGTITGLTAMVEGAQDGMMNFVMSLINSGYTYIGLNGEALLYMNAEDTLEISLQTLFNAVLNDNTFGSQTLIDLGTNGQGDLLKASMQLGNAADDLAFNDVDFVLHLTSVPSQMGIVARGLNLTKDFMRFQSEDGVMSIKLNVPEKVYEVYLTAMAITGHVTKDDMAALNDEIAFMFFYDYLDIIISSDADAETFANTLAKLGIHKDLSGYDEYYQSVKSVLTNDGIVINSIEDDGIFDINVTANGATAINGLLSLIGINQEQFGTYLGMIKEYKENSGLSVTTVPTLEDACTEFEALVIDVDALIQGARDIANNPTVGEVVDNVQGEGLANGVDFTTDLVQRNSEITGEAAIILLDDVDGDLTFAGHTILDLNGKTINGNVTANGRLLIVDSYLDTVNCGGITGTISGNVSIIGGNYNVDVSAYLKDGYTQVDGAVKNAVYTIEMDEDGNLTYVINTGFMHDETVDGYLPSIQALAIDITVDMILNYYTTAALSADGAYLYHIDFYDLIGLLDSTDKVDDLVNRILACIDVPGMSDFANNIMADLLNFAAIEEALANGEPIATYAVSTEPWMVEVEHQTAGDYITFGITSNTELAHNFNVSLRLEGDYVDYLERLTGELADIVVADNTFVILDLAQPTFSNKVLTLSGGVSASLDIDLSQNPHYMTIIGVIMANGVPEDASMWVNALNLNSRMQLVTLINNTTVEEIFDALKALNRNEDFAALAEKVGVDFDVTNAAELESLYHLFLVGVGKILDVLEIDGPSGKLSSLFDDETGSYVYEARISRSGDVSRGGYTVDVDVTHVELSIRIKLFDCLWGDADHDGDVDNVDAMLVLQYYVGLIPTLEDGTSVDICMRRIDVNGDGVINNVDAMLILQRYVGIITRFPVEN